MIARRIRLSYAAGDLGFNFVWQSIELYLLFFYVRELGLSPEAASGIFLAGAVIDWIADPLIGAASDRMAPRVPLRLWVLLGGPLAAGILILVFSHPPLTGTMLAMAALVTHLALRVAYSLGNIPYAALTARISSDPADHLALTGTRMQGAALGGLIAVSIFALLPTEGGGADFRIGAILLALLALPAFIATWAGVRETVTPPPQAKESPLALFAAMPRLVARSAPLRRVLLAILAAGLSVTVTNKSLLFLFEEIGAPRMGFVVALLPALSLLLTTPVWALVATRIGRVPTLAIAAALNAAATLLALVFRDVVPLTVLMMLAITAGNGMSVMFWSLVPVAVADAERHAQGYAGRVYALSSIARKLAQALAPLIVAVGLSGAAQSVLPGLAVTALATLTLILLYPPRGARRGLGTKSPAS